MDLQDAQKVYVMSNPLGMYKIGISVDPVRRSKQVSSNSGLPVELLYVYETKTPAFTIEHHLHHIFREYRKLGEWFEVDLDILRNYIRDVIDHPSKILYECVEEDLEPIYYKKTNNNVQKITTTKDHHVVRIKEVDQHFNMFYTGKDLHLLPDKDFNEKFLGYNQINFPFCSNSKVLDALIKKVWKSYFWERSEWLFNSHSEELLNLNERDVNSFLSLRYPDDIEILNRIVKNILKFMKGE